jgi:ribosomal protein S18 acetylase RimI-like enzyme
MRTSRMMITRRDWLFVKGIEKTNVGGYFDEQTAYQTLCFMRSGFGRVIDSPCGSVAAYAIFAMHRDCIDLQNLTVHANYRGLGHASELLAYLKSKLHPERRTRIVCVVHESNAAGCRFLLHNGFRFSRSISQAFESPSADGYLFEFSIEE